MISEQAEIVASLPIEMPGKTVEFAPSITFFPIVTGPYLHSLIKNSWQRIVELKPMIELSAIEISSGKKKSKVTKGEIATSLPILIPIRPKRKFLREKKGTNLEI